MLLPQHNAVPTQCCPKNAGSTLPQHNTAPTQRQVCSMIRVGQDHMHTVYISINGREITKYTVIYGEHHVHDDIRFWPALSATLNLA
jgi:hypothetical protein